MATLVVFVEDNDTDGDYVSSIEGTDFNGFEAARDGEGSGGFGGCAPNDADLETGFPAGLFSVYSLNSTWLPGSFGNYAISLGMIRFDLSALSGADTINSATMRSGWSQDDLTSGLGSTLRAFEYNFANPLVSNDFIPYVDQGSGKGGANSNDWSGNPPTELCNVDGSQADETLHDWTNVSTNLATAIDNNQGGELEVAIAHAVTVAGTDPDTSGPKYNDIYFQADPSYDIRVSIDYTPSAKPQNAMNQYRRRRI
jgi:hypothetical protein